MHPYATDSSERRMMPLVFAGAAIISAWLLSTVLHYLNLDLRWLEVPSVLGFYKIWYSWFDHSGWKKRFFRRFGWVKVPDLNGKWEATGQSSHDQRTYSAKVSIKQTWTSIRLKWETKNHARIAALLP
jgi:hypothetical protein